MFDELLSHTAGSCGASAVQAWARVENAACARRLAAMVTILDTAFAAAGSAEREQWYLDNWGAVSAHIGAAQRITSGTASNLLIVAVALRDRFPTVAAVFAEGLIGYPLVRTIVTRGALVVDPDALAALDSALAAALRCWEPMSIDKTEQTIDAFIDRVDPHAVRRRETRARSRSLDIHLDDGSGLAALFGTLFSTDAKALDARVDALARTVCPADPRTIDQRRADAMGALAHGTDRLACQCGTEDCPAGENPPSTGVIIHLVVDQDTPDGPANPGPAEHPGRRADPAADTAADECAALDGCRPLFPTGLRNLTLVEALTEPDPGRLGAIRPAALWGGQFVPGSIARRAALGARIEVLVHPGMAPPENRYTPSKKLADFVRCRDLTCRFPGCKEPATNCDVDHTIPWPYGPTQASNLKCLCRRHHLLKTFWNGENGWRDNQHPDGIVDWIGPDGQRYSTTPGSRLLFPTLSRPTAPVAETAVPPHRGSGLTMPHRKSTRGQDRARRIHDEREANRLAAEEAAAQRSKEQVAEEVPPF